VIDSYPRSGVLRRPGAERPRASALPLRALLPILLLAGCVRDVPLLAPGGLGDEPGSLPAPPPEGYPDPARPYPLLPGDEIEIRVLEPEEFSFQVPILSDGRVELLKSGTAEGRDRVRVEAKGRTVEELKEAIADAYEKARFQQRPYVVVTLLRAVKRVVYLQGAVKSEKGELELPPTGRLTLSRAIQAAGGTTEEADRSRVRILRRDPATGARVSLPAVDLEEMERLAAFDRDPPLEPEDVVSVPRLGKVSVFGNVNEPGRYLCTRRMTLTDLLAEAGGLKPFSKLREVLVIRGGEGTSTERTYYVDVEAIFDGRAPDPVLASGDRVYVDEDWK
jgi:protein involved in polysaccharide export with SLBB domain